MSSLYFDCFAGISGNMILGGLISLGVNPAEIKRELEKLDISGFDFEISDVIKAGIASIHVKTVYPDQHEHRHLKDIAELIHRSNLSPYVKKNALNVFEIIADAEGKIHGVGRERVHFHEVGAMDSILDIVGICIGFELLGVEEVSSSKINLGSGFIEMEHGKYPVPPPAVAEILLGVPTYSNEIEGELTTPTGAAILKAFCNKFGGGAEFTAKKIGYGAGTREYASFPNVLRLILGDTNANLRSERLILLESNIDDSTPERLGNFLEMSLEAGALDCWFTAIQMKKCRLGTQISILCKIDDREKIMGLLFLETTTIGVRMTEIERACLAREEVPITCKYGIVSVKWASYGNKIVNAKAEFEDLRRISIESGKSIDVIERDVMNIFWEQNPNG